VRAMCASMPDQGLNDRRPRKGSQAFFLYFLRRLHLLRALRASLSVSGHLLQREIRTCGPD